MSETDEPWHESDAFWRVMSRVIFQEPMWERARKEVVDLVESLDVQPDAAVLDLGCGPGRHALEFAERGYRVTGVDRTSAFLDRARRSARERGVEVDWVEEDMRSFCREEAFDLAVNLYTTFGYFDRRSENLSVLENVRASLRPGGTFVMELTGKEFLAANFKERTWQEFEDGTLFLAKRSVEGPWEWMHNRWLLVEPDGNRYEFHMRHRIYSAVELRERLDEAGFESIEISGALAGGEFDRSSSLVASARAP